jgi:hypothetical protein
MDPLVLTVRPDPLRPGSFFAGLADGDVIVQSRQPLVDGARELLARGYPPEQPLTMRHYNRPYASFEPRPIGDWAKWTYSEPKGRGTLARIPWMPFPDKRCHAGSELRLVWHPTARP